MDKNAKSIFNKNMTSSEARTILFKAVEGKTKEEIEEIEEIKEIKAEYLKVLPAIFEREHRLASEGWFID